MSRRNEKRVYTHNGSAWATTPSEHKRFVWSGWLMLLELDETAGTPPTIAVRRKQTWGLDLAGQHGGGNSLEPAGGIGGLLAVEDTNATPATTDDQSLAFLYDANGNVGQVVDWAQTTASAALKAKYEYDVYGNVTSSGGSYATANPFRFSTKYWDDETGLGYWGYRYYEPRMGRWMSRDPIEEFGGLNILSYVGNGPIDFSDSLGLMYNAEKCRKLMEETQRKIRKLSDEVKMWEQGHKDGKWKCLDKGHIKELKQQMENLQKELNKWYDNCRDRDKNFDPASLVNHWLHKLKDYPVERGAEFPSDATVPEKGKSLYEAWCESCEANKHKEMQDLIHGLVEMHIPGGAPAPGVSVPTRTPIRVPVRVPIRVPLVIP